MAEPTVGAGFARGLLDFAVTKGADRAELARAAGIDVAALEDHDGRVPFMSYVALMRAAKAMTGDEALALHFGEAVDISSISIVGLIGQACATMIDSLAQLNRYVRLVVETGDGGPGVDRFRLERDGDSYWITDTRPFPNLFPELTESAFAQLVCRAHRLLPPSMLKAVYVTHADPGYADEYARIFRAPVSFASDRNALHLDAAWATQRVDLLPRYVFGVLAERADALMRNLEQSNTVRARVESLIMPVLHTGEASMEAVAARMGLSRQTLFRKLKAEGVTFAQLLDQLRHQLALDYLGARKVSVNETAYLLGFSDPAAFSRAFKRWTGKSPRAMRSGQ